MKNQPHVENRKSSYSGANNANRRLEVPGRYDPRQVVPVFSMPFEGMRLFNRHQMQPNPVR